MLKRFDVESELECRWTKALGFRMHHRKQRPTAVMQVCRLSCRQSDCSQASTSRWITNVILLGIMQQRCTKP